MLVRGEQVGVICGEKTNLKKRREIRWEMFKISRVRTVVILLLANLSGISVLSVTKRIGNVPTVDFCLPLTNLLAPALHVRRRASS